VTLILSLLTALFTEGARATTSESYNFNTTGDLANNFNATVSSGTYSQSTTGGVGNSGAINAPGSLNAIFATKNSYSIGSVGSTYTFSSYMQMLEIQVIQVWDSQQHLQRRVGFHIARMML
jgi:hypothetical protein